MFFGLSLRMVGLFHFLSGTVQCGCHKAFVKSYIILTILLLYLQKDLHRQTFRVAMQVQNGQNVINLVQSKVIVYPDLQRILLDLHWICKSEIAFFSSVICLLFFCIHPCLYFVFHCIILLYLFFETFCQELFLSFSCLQFCIILISQMQCPIEQFPLVLQIMRVKYFCLYILL